MACQFIVPRDPLDGHLLTQFLIGSFHALLIAGADSKVIAVQIRDPHLVFAVFLAVSLSIGDQKFS
jgi:hypothetical protein